MTEPILSVRMGRHACRLALVVALQTPLAIAASARDEAGSGNLDAMLSGWDAFAGLMARGWSDMKEAAVSLPMPELPAPASLLTTHTVCAGSDGAVGNDCSIAVSVVCHQHGFASGRQIDIESRRICRLAPQGLARTEHAIACKSKVWLTQVACW